MESKRLQFPEKAKSLFEPHRYKVLRGGRGSAKSWTVARILLLIGLQRPLRVLCTRETQKSIRDSVHKLLVDQIARMGLAAYYQAKQVQITGPRGTEFVFAGLSDLTADSIKSFEGADVVWVEEGQTVTDRSWTILIPTIRKDGSEIWVTFNPELDTDPTWTRFVERAPPDTLGIEMNWRDNPWFNKVLDDERRHAQETLSKIDYENIWEGKCRPAVSGAIYADEMATMFSEGRIGSFPHDPRLLVYPVFDLGWNDSMSIGLWQCAASSLRLIDYLENDHKTYAWYTQELHKRSFNWGHVTMPHDAEHGNPQTGQTAKQTMENLGWRVEVLPNDSHVNDDIRLTRMAFPTMHVNQATCGKWIEHIKRYRRAIPSTTGEPGAPVHNSHSHAGDMTRYAVRGAPMMTNATGMSLPPLKYPKVLV